MKLEKDEIKAQRTGMRIQQFAEGITRTNNTPFSRDRGVREAATSSDEIELSMTDTRAIRGTSQGRSLDLNLGHGYDQ